ncbi:MAG: hypothetical protein AAF432_17010 [Planctomycetota bacterium]
MSSLPNDACALAQEYLGGLSIPCSYAIRNGEVISTLRGQRSAVDVLEWLDEVNAADS